MKIANTEKKTQTANLDTLAIPVSIGVMMAISNTETSNQYGKLINNRTLLFLKTHKTWLKRNVSSKKRNTLRSN